MQRIVNCKLNIDRFIDSKKESSFFEGKGYYKCDNDEIIVFFESNEIKYKYIYKDSCLTIMCNNSKYRFKENEKCLGEIKNGDYVFKITTLANKIEVSDSYIILNYSLYQNDLLGNYSTRLSFN